MQTLTTTTQRLLPFDGTIGETREQRVERMLSGKIRDNVQAAARYFDERALVEALQQARLEAERLRNA
jgi:hypothetical protein